LFSKAWRLLFDSLNTLLMRAASFNAYNKEYHTIKAMDVKIFLIAVNTSFSKFKILMDVSLVSFESVPNEISRSFTEKT
jgi:hypothetical protein